MAMLGSFFNC